MPAQLRLGVRQQEQRREVEKRPRLLTGCCAYSYSKLLSAGKMTTEDIIRKAVELGIDGVDMTAYWFKSTDPAYLASLRHLAFKHGVCFSGAAIGASTVQAGVDMPAYWFKSSDPAFLASVRHLAIKYGGYVFPARPLEPAQCRPKRASGLRS